MRKGVSGRRGSGSRSLLLCAVENLQDRDRRLGDHAFLFLFVAVDVWCDICLWYVQYVFLICSLFSLYVCTEYQPIDSRVSFVFENSIVILSIFFSLLFLLGADYYLVSPTIHSRNANQQFFLIARHAEFANLGSQHCLFPSY